MSSTILIEKTPLLLGLGGGSLIVSGVSAMNTMPTTKLQQGFGIPLFSTGWLLVAMSFLKSDSRFENYNNILAGASAGVFGFAVLARLMADSGTKGLPIMASKMAFVAAWIVLGISVGMKKQGVSKDADGIVQEEEVKIPKIRALGLVVPAMVIMAMGLINGVERPRKLSGGMGAAVFTGAWTTLALVNSTKIESPIDKLIKCEQE